MLHLPNPNSMSGQPQRSEGGFMPQLDLLALMRMCYRQWPVVLGALGLALLLGTMYLATAQRRYTASFLIMVDTRKSQVMARQDASGDRQLDPGLVDSQVEILKSDSVALSVVRDLKLTNDPDFVGKPGLISRVLSLGGVGTPRSQEDLEKSAVDTLTAGVRAKRIGVTYVIQVDYIGTNAEKAAAIANALSDSYMVGELEARYQATRRASRWLEDRIKELREQSGAADLAVQKFKSDNNIIDTSRGLMSEQQLADVNTQLVTARAGTAESKARFDRVQEVINSDIVNGTVADALRNEVITRLRAQYLDISAREANFAARYGKDHRAVMDLRKQMTEIERTAREELQRVAESAKSDYEISQARERSLRESLDQLISQAGSSNQAQVKLRDLESSAQSYRSLYESFLQKFQEATQEQTFPVINARIITPAAVPTRPSSPRAILIYAGSLVFGLALGFGAALFRELLGNNFRTPEDVNNYAGLECLGVLPHIGDETQKSRGLRSVTAADGILGSANPIARHVIIAPFSRFTETIRNVKVSLDIARGANRSAVIGITSSVPTEGKTTFSSNLAQLTAQMGHRTLLIDGDMHSPSLTKTLQPGLELGLVDFLNGKASLSSIIQRDAVTGLDFIPTVVTERHANIVALLTSTRMNELIESARKNYDYIYVDLPPVVPVVDVKACMHLFDNYVFVIEWANTSRDVVRDAMLSVEPARQRFVGAILNKADPAELKRLEAYRGAAYGNYYVEADAA